MKGFKDSTKTEYSAGGSCYAKGGSVKGAAKIAKVMGEFKSGTLHSGSKKGPEVTNPKQAVAIALSEARKAKAPVKKAMGGAISARPTNRSGRPISDEELSTPERILRQSGRADPYERTPPPLSGKGKPRAVTVKTTEVTEEPVSRSALDRTLSRLPSQRGETKNKGSFRNTPLIGGALEALGLKKGGLAVMPRGKR